MNFETLRQSRLYVDRETPPSPQKLKAPDHVLKFQRIILDDDCTILNDFRPLTDEQLLDIETDPRWRQFSEREIADIRDLKERTKALCEKFERLERGRFPESEWQAHFNDEFLKSLQDVFLLRKDDDRRSLRRKYYYEYFERTHDEYWNLFRDKDSWSEERSRDLTIPKPDCAFYFPVHDFEWGGQIPGGNRWRWQSHAQDSLMENFSYETLSKLSGLGLLYNPRVSRREQQKTNTWSKAQDLCCFPWLIVEHKKDDRTREEHVICQAANASLAALLLMGTAACHAEDQRDCKHVPPVPAITTVGKDVQVWITYKHHERNEDCYRMQSIWKGDMTCLVDIIKLQVFLENIHTWAAHTLKPLLSTYIDQWKYRQDVRNVRREGVDSSMSRKRGQVSLSIEETVSRAIKEQSISLGKVDENDISSEVVRDIFVRELADLFDRLKAIIEAKALIADDPAREIERILRHEMETFRQTRRAADLNLQVVLRHGMEKIAESLKDQKDASHSTESSYAALITKVERSIDTKFEQWSHIRKPLEASWTSLLHTIQQSCETRARPYDGVEELLRTSHELLFERLQREIEQRFEIWEDAQESVKSSANLGIAHGIEGNLDKLEESLRAHLTSEISRSHESSLQKLEGSVERNFKAGNRDLLEGIENLIKRNVEEAKLNQQRSESINYKSVEELITSNSSLREKFQSLNYDMIESLIIRKVDLDPVKTLLDRKIGEWDARHLPSEAKDSDQLLTKIESIINKKIQASDDTTRTLLENVEQSLYTIEVQSLDTADVKQLLADIGDVIDRRLSASDDLSSTLIRGLDLTMRSIEAASKSRQALFGRSFVEIEEFIDKKITQTGSDLKTSIDASRDLLKGLDRRLSALEVAGQPPAAAISDPLLDKKIEDLLGKFSNSAATSLPQIPRREKPVPRVRLPPPPGTFSDGKRSADDTTHQPTSAKMTPPGVDLLDVDHIITALSRHHETEDWRHVTSSEFTLPILSKHKVEHEGPTHKVHIIDRNGVPHERWESEDACGGTATLSKTEHTIHMSSTSITSETSGFTAAGGINATERSSSSAKQPENDNEACSKRDPKLPDIVQGSIQPTERSTPESKWDWNGSKGHIAHADWPTRITSTFDLATSRLNTLHAVESTLRDFAQMLREAATGDSPVHMNKEKKGWIDDEVFDGGVSSENTGDGEAPQGPV